MLADRTPHFRFDPFVFSPETGSLKRDGYEVRLPEQAAKVLDALLRSPNLLVTRKQISQILWPEGIFTESEQGINNTISKLRLALRDDSNKPKYIETIPKRGYRFLAPVETVEFEAEAGLEAAPLAPVQNSTVEWPLPQTPETNAATPETTSSQAATTRPAAVVGFSGTLGRMYWLAAALLLVAIGGIALLLVRHRAPPSAPQEVTLAIAPFEVRGTDPGREQLAESFRLDLTDALAQLPGIAVRAAHSVGPSHADGAAPRNTPDAVNLTAIVYTTFTQNGNQCGLQVELVRNSDFSHLTSWRYSGTVTQLGALRDQIQRDIFTYWNSTARSRSPRHAIEGGTEDPDAYELYLRARYHARQRTPASLDTAMREYREALVRDPQFAKAYSGLADASLSLAEFMVTDKKTGFSKAESYALKALQIAPNLAEAHAILGYSYFRNDWRFVDGEQEMRHAIALDPNEPVYHIRYAVLLTALQRFEDAAKELEIARRDDPYWAPVYATEAYLAASSRQPEKMNKATDMLVSLKPDWPGTYDELAWGYWLSHQYPKAIAEWRRMALMEKDDARVAMEDRGMAAFAAGGEKAYAQLRLKTALARPQNDPADADFQIAEWYAYAGDYEKCLVELSRMVDDRDVRALELAVNPAYEPLHHTAQYQELLRRVGLPPPKI